MENYKAQLVYTQEIPVHAISEKQLNRFLSYIDAGADDECWEWNRNRNPCGYGIISLTLEGKKYWLRAHRLAYTLAKGPIPEGMVIDHLCRNRACCNPHHMEAVTNWENTLRGKGTKLSRDDIKYIYTAITEGRESYAELSKKFNVSRASLSRIKHSNRSIYQDVIAEIIAA